LKEGFFLLFSSGDDGGIEALEELAVSVVAIGNDCDVTGRSNRVKRGSKERSEEKGMETSQLFEQNRNKKRGRMQKEELGSA
jgi:hypothetical protein